MLLSQITVTPSYTDIRKKYENLEKEDQNALRYVSAFIEKAKNEDEFEKLCLGYKDAVYFSKDINRKLSYTDSTIAAAFKSGKDELISDAYLGKGIIYYFNLRKFQLASDEYVKAYQIALKTDDKYLQTKILYHLGVVKSYLGYYNQALQLFNQSIEFNEKNSKVAVNPNLRYNYCRGYLNSLHQMAICHLNLNQNAKADSLLMVGLVATKNKSEFTLERAYFLKCTGIIYYQNNKYNDALYYLKKSLPVLNLKNDFTWTSVIHFYLGNIYLKNGENKKGILELKKVDSIYNQHQFILPEASEAYKLLISYYKNTKNEKEQLYYTNQLLKVNQGIRKDFAYLAEKIYEDFEIAGLVREKYKLEKSLGIQYILVIFAIVFSIMLIIILVWRYVRERDLKKRYADLLSKLNSMNNPMPFREEKQLSSIKVKNDLPDELMEKLTRKVQNFEEKKQFLEAGITAVKLAERFKTNPTYLSTFIRESKGLNFSNYITQLRIEYITHKLNSDKEYPKYTIQALAEMCGIASRNNFTEHFKRINGIGVADFIKMKMKDNERVQ